MLSRITILLILLTTVFAEQLVKDPNFNWNFQNGNNNYYYYSDVWDIQEYDTYCQSMNDCSGGSGPYSGTYYIEFTTRGSYYGSSYTSAYVKQTIKFPNSGNGTLSFYMSVKNSNGNSLLNVSDPFRFSVKLGNPTLYYLSNDGSNDGGDTTISTSGYQEYTFPFEIDQETSKDLQFEFTRLNYRGDSSLYLSVDVVNINFDADSPGTWYYILIPTNLIMTIGFIVALSFFSCSSKRFYARF
jgi:hypothetical protein